MVRFARARLAFHTIEILRGLLGPVGDDPVLAVAEDNPELLYRIVSHTRLAIGASLIPRLAIWNSASIVPGRAMTVAAHF